MPLYTYFFPQKLRFLCSLSLFALSMSPFLRLQPSLCLRTSNMVDRQMQAMDRWLFNRQYFSGHMDSANYCIRAWALLHNYRPYCPRAKIGNQYHSPAHQLNKMTYRENWLENLLVSTSCQGFRQKHRKSYHQQKHRDFKNIRLILSAILRNAETNSLVSFICLPSRTDIFES